MKYIPLDKTIWCPFDKEWSAYCQKFNGGGGYNIIRSHIDDGLDFFDFLPKKFDLIVSNPPFSIKDEVLERLYEINKPFAILLPLNSLQGTRRYECFKKGIQLLTFDQRIGFHRIDSMNETIESTPFASAYFCKDLLPKDLIVEHIEKYESNLEQRNRIEENKHG